MNDIAKPSLPDDSPDRPDRKKRVPSSETILTASVCSPGGRSAGIEARGEAGPPPAAAEDRAAQRFTVDAGVPRTSRVPSMLRKIARAGPDRVSLNAQPLTSMGSPAVTMSGCSAYGRRWFNESTR